jgi:large subunit ribosomal protein L6
MSKISKKTIKLDPSVKANVSGAKFKVTGPKGELYLDFPGDIQVTVADGVVTVSTISSNRTTFGLYAALITNLVNGVKVGFKKDLEMVGIGYKAKKEGPDLVLTIGYSHPVRYTPPTGCEISVSDDTRISVAGNSRELVGQVASEIKKLKKPEPYKGKGIKYVGEIIRRKAGKAGKVGAAK